MPLLSLFMLFLLNCMAFYACLQPVYIIFTELYGILCLFTACLYYFYWIVWHFMPVYSLFILSLLNCMAFYACLQPIYIIFTELYGILCLFAACLFYFYWILWHFMPLYSLFMLFYWIVWHFIPVYSLFILLLLICMAFYICLEPVHIIFTEVYGILYLFTACLYYFYWIVWHFTPVYNLFILFLLNGMAIYACLQ